MPMSRANVTNAGYHAVLSAPFYLNIISYGMDWWTYYQVEPANFTGGSAAEAAKKIAGVKACYWSAVVLACWCQGVLLVRHVRGSFEISSQVCVFIHMS